MTDNSIKHALEELAQLIPGLADGERTRVWLAIPTLAAIDLHITDGSKEGVIHIELAHEIDIEGVLYRYGILPEANLIVASLAEWPASLLIGAEEGVE